jgi:hypothetical protein
MTTETTKERAPRRKIAGKTLEITVKGSQTLPLEKLEPFQGSLKHLERTEYEALRKTLGDFGFSFVVHVWKDKGKFFIIDGHQRVFTLNQMKAIEGWTIPEIPVAVVEAESYAEAKRKVLAAASQYGKLTKDSLAQFMRENDIPYEDMVSNFHFPEVDFSQLAATFVSPTDGSIPAPADIGSPNTGMMPEKTMASGSTQVKQLQLFFTMDDYVDFVSMVEALQTVRGTDNISDTLLGIVREAHKATVKAQ